MIGDYIKGLTLVDISGKLEKRLSIYFITLFITDHLDFTIMSNNSRGFNNYIFVFTANRQNQYI